MIIAIQFFDNDYIRTYEALGRVLLEALRKEESLRQDERGNLVSQMSKETLASTVNQLLAPMYTLYQQSPEHELTSEEVAEYLAITPDRIYIDEEAWNFINTEFTNNEVLVINTDLDYTGNRPVDVI
jgi:hypothetical protein